MTPPVAAVAGAEPFLVLGVGNELFTDEGLGCVAATRVAERVAAEGIEGVAVADGSTLGLGLLPALADRRCVLLLDAVLSAGSRPGDVLVLEGDDVPITRQLTMSAHQIGVSEALSAAQFAGCCPPVVVAAGIVPAVLETGYGLSPAVEASMDALVEAALVILRRWAVGGNATSDPAAGHRSGRLARTRPPAAV
ncbi:hydrogenase maturation protease [Kineosporia sp. A_224]|uniref:hydrogenase maturation protease n=1 Tax=Kineosporia sp. A_224 TaxID=1962180 RepID=UPI000B4B8520|nr:hydrogenase maturation protease [Kineosporia sp. A_224]